MAGRNPITAIAGAAIVLAVVLAVVGRVTPVAAQDADDDLYRDLDVGPAEGSAEPWVGWQGPLDDGLLGLRFGMDRFAVGATLRERGLGGRSSRSATLRFEGDVLGSAAEVVAEFRPDHSAKTGERLSRIQIVWVLYGVPNKAVRLYEELDAMLASRYGTPLLAEDDGFGALDSGWGRNRRYYVGVQAKAYLELQATRSERYQLVLSLESPQLHVGPPAGDLD